MSSHIAAAMPPARSLFRLDAMPGPLGRPEPAWDARIPPADGSPPESQVSLADIAARLGILDADAFDASAHLPAQVRRLRAGEPLYRSSDPLRHAFVVTSGVVATISADGRRIAFVSRGESLGLGWRSRTHADSAVALTPVEVMAVPLGPLLRATEASVLIGAAMMGRMSVGLLRERQVTAQLLDLLPYSRLIGGLHYLARLAGPLPQQSAGAHRMPVMLARQLLRPWLQLEQESLSAGLRQLERYRVLGTCFEDVHWLDAELLRELAHRMGPLGRLRDLPQADTLARRAPLAA